MFDLRDPVSSSTHLFTALWALFATLLMWRLTRGDRLRRLTATIYGASMVTLYLASGLFHGLRLAPAEFRIFQKIDQSAIYTLIAGSCTPIVGLLLTGAFRKWLLIAIWTMAFVGIGCLWLLNKAPHEATVGMYLGMGWLGCVGIWHYYRAVGWSGVSWLIGGAVFYTLGAVCELAKWPTIWPGVVGAHEVLHISDMIGTFCHFVFIVRFALAYRPEAIEVPASVRPQTSSSSAWAMNG